MNATESTVTEPLLIEWLAAQFGFDRLAERLPGNIASRYLYLCTFLFLDAGIINIYIHFYTESAHVFIDQPYVIVAPIGLLLAAAGIRYFATGYATAIDSLPLKDSFTESTEFKQFISLRSKIVVYAIAVTGMYLFTLFVVGIDNIVAAEGQLSLLNYLLIWQLGYLPFIIEFGILYFGIHILLPRRIAKADISMFFYATRNMGGFAPIGQLLKYSYYFFTAGLLLYFILVYGPVLFSFGGTVAVTPGLIEAALFSTAWIGGVGSITYSMWTIHRVMAAEKAERIDEIEAEMEDTIDNPYDINNSSVDMEQLEDIRQRRQEIRDTRVYPASFTMWSQIVMSVLLPQALNLAIQAVG